MVARSAYTASSIDAEAGSSTDGWTLADTLGDDGPSDVLRDTARWLRHFDPGALVELDYGGLVGLMDDQTLAADTSAEDVAEALAALREGDAERAMASYRRLRDFWAGRAAHQRAN